MSETCAGCEFTEVYAEIIKEFPKFKEIKKTESRFMRLIGTLLGLIGADNFMVNFTTTIGTTVYTPYKWGFYSDATRAVVLRHELVHMRQAKRYTFPIFAFLYLFFPLPILFAYFRAKFEMEAYEVNLEWEYTHKEHLMGGHPEAEARHRRETVKLFTGPDYGWMALLHESTVQNWYTQAVKRIRG